jgi:hypothetical protein
MLRTFFLICQKCVRGGSSSANGQYKRYHATTATELLLGRIRLAVCLLLVTDIFRQRDFTAGLGSQYNQSVIGVTSGVEAVEYPAKWRPRLDVLVEPKYSILDVEVRVNVRCTVSGWTRTAIEQSQLRVGFYVRHILFFNL